MGRAGPDGEGPPGVLAGYGRYRLPQAPWAKEMAGEHTLRTRVETGKIAAGRDVVTTGRLRGQGERLGRFLAAGLRRMGKASGLGKLHDGSDKSSLRVRE